MKFRKIEPRLIDFFLFNCGIFSNLNNNEYSNDFVPFDDECRFLECEEKNIEDKQEPGICCIDDCPFGYSASLENMKELCPRTYKEWKAYLNDKGDNKNPVDYGSTWFIQEWEFIQE